METIHVTSGTKQKIILNALGTKFQITQDVFSKISSRTRLGILKDYERMHMHDILGYCDDFDLTSLEFFFNRDPDILKLVLNHAVTGEFHWKTNLCEVYLERELVYWKFDMDQINHCCSTSFDQKYENKKELMEKDHQIIERLESEDNREKTTRQKIWSILNNPLDSALAMAYFLLTNLILLSWLAYFLYGTFPNIRQPIKAFVEQAEGTEQAVLDRGSYLYTTFLIIDVVFFSYFLIDFIFRFIVCPQKKRFFLNLFNIWDLGTILLFWILFGISIGTRTEAVYFTRRIIESFRIFLLFRIFNLHWKFRTITKTFVASAYELIIGFLAIFIFMVTMSSLVFYMEVNTNEAFSSVPATFWWTIVTITTVGYGDMYPTSIAGKTIAGFIIIGGLALVAIPIGVVGSNFSVVSEQQERKHKLIEKHNKKNKTKSTSI